MSVSTQRVFCWVKIMNAIKKTELVHVNHGKPFTDTLVIAEAKAYINEISLMCSMFLELDDADKFKAKNFDSTVLSAISALGNLAYSQECREHISIFSSLKSKINEWYSLVYNQDDEATERYCLGIAITLDAMASYVFSMVIKPPINHAAVSEKQYKDEILKKWESLDVLNNYQLIKAELSVNGGVIDIFAKDKNSNRDVLIELKLGAKSGHKQLHQYAFNFHNPILINISEKIPAKLFGGIEYLTFSGIGLSLC